MDSRHHIRQILEIRTIVKHLSQTGLIHHLLTGRVDHDSTLRHRTHQGKIDGSLRFGSSRDMERNDLTSLEQLGSRSDSLHTIRFDHLSRTEGIIRINLHTEALGNASHITSDIAIRQNTQFLTFQFNTSRTIVEITHARNQQAKNQFGYGIGVLTRCIHHTHVMSRCSSQIHIVISGTGTYHNLQVRSSCQNSLVHLVTTDNQRIGRLHSLQQLCLIGIFFQQGELHTSTFHHLTNTLYGYGRKGFLCCY